MKKIILTLALVLVTSFSFANTNLAESYANNSVIKKTESILYPTNEFDINDGIDGYNILEVQEKIHIEIKVSVDKDGKVTVTVKITFGK